MRVPSPHPLCASLVGAALLLAAPFFTDVASGGIAYSSGDQELLALVGGTLVDGTGGPPLRNAVVLVEGERIRAVGPKGELEVPPEAEVVSTEGMTVLPGL